MKKFNRVMMADSYKYPQAKNQYPEHANEMFDYAEARSGKIYPATILAGLQHKLIKFFSEPIEEWEVREAKMYHEFHGTDFDFDGWMYIVNELKGKLPVLIRSVKEGTLIPTGNVLFTMKSTDPRVFWVASWLETSLMTTWSMSNVATRSYYVRKVLEKYAELTQDNPYVGYQFHNFGARGSFNPEAAQEAGMAHLMVGFYGSDNFSAMRGIMDYYGPDDLDDLDEDVKAKKAFAAMIMHAINATEHSSTASWGRDQEMDMIMNHLEVNKGQPLIAAVTDTYDYFKCTREICRQDGEFQRKINSPDYPIFVMRPDSGNPEEIINWTLDMMEEECVPYTINDKGFKVFTKMRLIWGDGINMENMIQMLNILVSRGYSSENLAFGSGGWLVQQHDRDTQGWAIKNSQVGIKKMGGTDYRDVFKDPITSPAKKSKKGELTLWYNKNTGDYFTDRTNIVLEDNIVDALHTVYLNGEMVTTWNLEEIRNSNK